MIRVWETCSPGSDGVTPVYERFTDNDVLNIYYPYWSERMVERYGIHDVGNNVSYERCIDDWVVVNWAMQIWNWDVDN